MESKKRKTIKVQGWESQPCFNQNKWPPSNDGGWKREYAMRIQPYVSSLLYHHPSHMCATIRHFCNAYPGVKKEVERQLVLSLPHGIEAWMVKQYKTDPQKPLEGLYQLSMVLDVREIRYSHPVILYKIISKLVQDDSFPQMSKTSVEKYIKFLTSTESDMRKAMRKLKPSP